MTDNDFPVASQEPSPKIDVTVPHSARVWNYFLGGKDHFPIDREAGDQARQVFPQIVDIARADRAFLGRAVGYLAGEAGVTQFLDVGTGLPTMDNTHEVAQRIAPESRIVYVDNDPLVLVHARALLVGSPEGATDYVEADLRDPDKILEAAAATLDLTRPVAVMLLGILHFIGDLDDACRIVNRLMDAIPPGSHLVLTHATLEIGDQSSIEANAQMNEEWNEKASTQIGPRNREQILRFFDGLELVEPGLVSMTRWRPEDDPLGLPPEVAGYCGVGRKP
ncbi:SAM-dependent methyltransferase [Microbispora sp. NPDC049125]|uniref:SAM-dependent methyltransferase n=1 Tax=Microbispora sp. NPDC049125 TaxID=3154929 RepID=UPI0034668BD1